MYISNPLHFRSCTRALSDLTWEKIATGASHRSRYLAHYNNTLSSDLLYSTFDHASLAQGSTSPPPLPEWRSNDPYAKNRSRPVSRTGVQQVAKPSSAKNVVRIEKLVLSMHVRQAPGRKDALIPAIAFLRAISGQHAAGRNLSHMKGVLPAGIEITRTRSKSASFKIRSGQQCGAKVTLATQQAIYDFLETLVEFVFPRLKDWAGIALPHPSRSYSRLPSSNQGSLSFGLPQSAMPLFPQVEMQLDSFPTQYGCHVHVITNVRGPGAQDQVRKLLSGLRLPLVGQR